MTLIQILLQFAPLLFENCPEKTNRDRAKAIKRRPGLARVRMRRVYRSQGHRGRTLRSKLRDFEQELEAATIDDVKDFLDDCCSMGAQL